MTSLAMNGHGKLPPTRTTTAVSCLNRFLSAMALVALGAIGGFAIFHSALQYRIEQTEQNHNVTLAIVTDRFVEAEKERNRCIETDDGRLQAISDLRGRLEAQRKNWDDLAAVQQSMVSKQRESASEIQRFREGHERDQRSLASLQAEYDQRARDLIAIREESAALQGNLKECRGTKYELESKLTKVQEAKKEETNNLQVQIGHKDREMENMKESIKDLSFHKEDLIKYAQRLQAEIRQKDEQLDSVNKNSENQKKQLEQYEAEMKNKIGKLELQISEKDKEILLYREQKGELQTKLVDSKETIRQKDEDLNNFNKTSDALQNQKQQLEQHIAEMKNEMGNLKLQIGEKDKELLQYREEEGELETKLINFREGMIRLLEEKVHEVQDLEKRVESINKEKANLEMKLDKWREGMLDLVKEKLREIDNLKAVLAESRKSMKAMMEEIELARSEQIEAQKFVRDRLESIDYNSDPEKEEMMQELMEEIERVRAELRESQDWVVTATEEIERSKLDQAKSEHIITDKTNEIKDLKQKIEKDQAHAKKQISKLESDLAKARKSVEEKTSEIERLNSELQEFVVEINNLKLVLTKASANSNNNPQPTTSETMIDHVQQRDGMICRRLFGKGPYYVKFVVKLPPAESNGADKTVFFVVELPSRKELPHSTYTLLTLVESNLYNDGAAFLSAQDGGGLKIASSHSPDVISLEQKLKPLGLTGGASLSFEETSTSGKGVPCTEYSLGFDHRGPGLNLFLSDKDEAGRILNDNETNCLATVIRGQDNLQKIQSLLLKNGEPMEIISAKHLRVD